MKSANQPAAGSRKQVSFHVPTDYTEGYERIRRTAPRMAANYIRHTLVGDPLAEAMTEDLAELGFEEGSRLLTDAINSEGEVPLRNAPESMRKFFQEAETPPDWLDYSAFAPAVRMFHRNSWEVLVAFVTAVLVEGFATNIAKSFFITGRLRDQGARRLGQNNRHIMEIFLPGGLERHGDGWKLSVRIRVVHARLRRLLSNSDDWDYDAWGVPISAAHLGFAITAFSARLLKHMKALGADYTVEEANSFMDVWRYTGHLMGIPETILFHNVEEALRIYEIGLMCEPPAPTESVVMANSLINSAPTIAGITEPEARRKMARYMYRLSKGLIGKEVSAQLHYPSVSSFGAVWQFRMEQRYKRAINLVRKVTGRRNDDSDFRRFMYLMEASMYDESGIRYELPDHVHAEKSRSW